VRGDDRGRREGMIPVKQGFTGQAYKNSGKDKCGGVLYTTITNNIYLEMGKVCKI